MWVFFLSHLLTVVACGSSPHGQCMVGFVLSASDGLVINSESLLGEVGREFPGLNEMRGQTEVKELFPVSGFLSEERMDHL